MTPLQRFLGALCIVGLLLLFFYSEISQILTYSVLNTTLQSYLHYTSQFCNQTSSSSSSTSAPTTSLDQAQQLYGLLLTNSSIRAQIMHTLNASQPKCNCSVSPVSPVPVPPVPCSSSGSSPAVAAIHQDPKKASAAEVEQWHSDKFWHSASTFPLCSMDACFDYTRCAASDEFLIYAYGAPFNLIWYLKELNGSRWHTTDPSKACIFLVTEPQHGDTVRRPHPSALPYWNAGGLNHVIATLADRWGLTAPLPHTIGNASVMSSALQQTTFRPGFDISIPLPGKVRMPHLQALKSCDRKYFLTFKGVRYLGHTEGNFRSDPALRAMHNGHDVIVAMSCNQVTNNLIRKEHPEAGHGCDEDQAVFQKYNFKDLMNSTFGLAPAGRSPASYRMTETLSAGTIPVLIVDNYVMPFHDLIQWHRCAFQFPTSQVSRILPALRRVPKEEVERRQKYCLFIYDEYLKDDATVFRSIVRSLKLRFHGMLPQFNEPIRTLE